MIRPPVELLAEANLGKTFRFEGQSFCIATAKNSRKGYIECVALENGRVGIGECIWFSHKQLTNALRESQPLASATGRNTKSVIGGVLLAVFGGPVGFFGVIGYVIGGKKGAAVGAILGLLVFVTLVRHRG